MSTTCDFDDDDDDAPVNGNDNTDDDGLDSHLDPLRRDLRPDQPLDTALSAAGLFPLFRLGSDDGRVRVVMRSPGDDVYRVIRECSADESARFESLVLELGYWEGLPPNIH